MKKEKYPKIERVPVARLQPAPWNYKAGGSKERHEKLRESIKRDGSPGVLAVRELKGSKKLEVIDGNHRFEDIRKIGWTETWVENFGPISKAEAITIAVRRNKEWFKDNSEKLDALLRKDVIPEIPVAELATFMPETERNLARLLESATGSTTDGEDDLPGSKKGGRVKRGEIWELGPHRIMCGDARWKDHVSKLMAGEKADLIFTDPPYGVTYQAAGGKHAKIKGDDLRGAKLIDLLTKSFKNMAGVAQDDAAFYIWHANSMRAEFEKAMTAAGIEENQYLIWAKPQLVMGWADYHWNHEPCYYASKAGKKAAWHGPRDQVTIWRVALRKTGGQAALIGPGIVVSDSKGAQIFISAKPPKKKMRVVQLEDKKGIELEPDNSTGSVWEVSRESGAIHPTQKPVELGRRAMENSTQPGESVLDLFAGSGSTLIAAETTGRRCFTMEENAGYCSAIIDRWENQTALKARKVKR